MLLRNVRHLFLNIKQEGGKETVKRLCFRFFRINTFYIYSLNLSQFNLAVSNVSGIEVREVKQKDLCELREKYEQLSSEFFIDQLEPGKDQRSFVCFVQDIPALILWLYPGKSSGFVDIETGQIEMNHIWCQVQFRGKKLLQHAICSITEQIEQEGFNEIITVVHADNIASIKSIQRCGFKNIGQLKRLGLLVCKSM